MVGTSNQSVPEMAIDPLCLSFLFILFLVLAQTAMLGFRHWDFAWKALGHAGSSFLRRAQGLNNSWVPWGFLFLQFHSLKAAESNPQPPPETSNLRKCLSCRIFQELPNKDWHDHMSSCQIVSGKPSSNSQSLAVLIVEGLSFVWSLASDDHKEWDS